MFLDHLLVMTIFFIAELIFRTMSNETQWPNEQRRRELARREPFLRVYRIHRRNFGENPLPFEYQRASFKALLYQTKENLRL
jgi:hypothetical protein